MAPVEASADNRRSDTKILDIVFLFSQQKIPVLNKSESIQDHTHSKTTGLFKSPIGKRVVTNTPLDPPLYLREMAVRVTEFRRDQEHCQMRPNLR